MSLGNRFPRVLGLIELAGCLLSLTAALSFEATRIWRPTSSSPKSAAFRPERSRCREESSNGFRRRERQHGAPPKSPEAVLSQTTSSLLRYRGRRMPQAFWKNDAHFGAAGRHFFLRSTRRTNDGCSEKNCRIDGGQCELRHGQKALRHHDGQMGKCSR